MNNRKRTGANSLIPIIFQREDPVVRWSGQIGDWNRIDAIFHMPITFQKEDLVVTEDQTPTDKVKIYVQHGHGSEWMNVNERMVTLGHAWVMRRFYNHLPKDRQQKLNRLERWARSKMVGLWQTPDPIPPWMWRKEV